MKCKRERERNRSQISFSSNIQFQFLLNLDDRITKKKQIYIERRKMSVFCSLNSIEIEKKKELSVSK